MAEENRENQENQENQEGQENQKSQIYRKKSLDRLDSPEQLNDYIRVTNPGIWLLLGGIIVLLVGACIWGIFGRIGKTDINNAVAIASDGELRCYTDENVLDGYSDGVRIMISVDSLAGNKETQEYTVTSTKKVTLTDTMEDMKLLSTVGYQAGNHVLVLRADCDLSDGLYTSDVHIEGETPFSLLDR